MAEIATIILPVGSSTKDDRINKTLGALSYVIDKKKLAVGNGYSFDFVGGVNQYKELNFKPRVNDIEFSGNQNGRYYKLLDEDRVLITLPSKAGFFLESLDYTEGAEADKPSEGYYHATDANKWFKDAIEIVVETNIPTPSLETKGKYYVEEVDGGSPILWLSCEGASTDKIPSAEAVRVAVDETGHQIDISIADGTFSYKLLDKGGNVLDEKSLDFKTLDSLEWDKDNVKLVATYSNGTTEDIKLTDVVMLDKEQTLTNKGIDADDNDISNLETDNFKSGVLEDKATDDSTKLPTSKAVKKEIINDDTSSLDYDNSQADKDKIVLKIKNNDGETKVDKEIDFEDKIVFAKKDQKLENKDFDADKNNLSNIELDNFKDGVIKTTMSDEPSDESLITEKGAKEYVDSEIENAKRGFQFKGYVSTSEPTGTLKKDELWYNSSSKEMPTTFPINVKLYDGTSWSEETIEYTPQSMDLWSNKNNDNGYYWFGNKWNIIDLDIALDNITLELNAQNQIQVKNGAITNDKINSSAKATTIRDKDTAVDEKLATEKATRTELDKKVDIDQAESDNGKVLQVVDKKVVCVEITDYIEVTELPSINIQPRFYNLIQKHGTYKPGIYWHNGTTWIVVGNGKGFDNVTAISTITDPSYEQLYRLTQDEVSGSTILYKKGFYYATKEGETIAWNPFSARAVIRCTSLPTSDIDQEMLYKLTEEHPGRSVIINNYYGLTATGATQYTITNLGLMKISTGAVAYDWASIMTNLQLLLNTSIIEVNASGLICVAMVDNVQGAYYRTNVPQPIEAQYKGLYCYDGERWIFLENGKCLTYYEFKELQTAGLIQNGIIYYIQNYQETATSPLKNVIYCNGQFYAGAGNVLADISIIDFGVEHQGKTIRINSQGKCEFLNAVTMDYGHESDYEEVKETLEGFFLIDDVDGNKETEISDLDSQKYSTTTAPSNHKFQNAIDDLEDRVKASEGAEVRRGVFDSDDITTIDEDLTQYMHDTWSRAPRTGDKILVTLNGRDYADYVYGEDRWVKAGNKLDQDVTDDMTNNTYNVAHVNHTSDGMQSLTMLGKSMK